MDHVGTSAAELFARPDVASRVQLPMAPVLESWNAADHPDQRRLQNYLDQLMALIELTTVPPAAPLVVELIVGLPSTVTVDSGGRDLDNYLMPVVRRIGAARVAAAFGRKVVQPLSTFAIGIAEARIQPAQPPCLTVHTRTSTQSLAWKQQIQQACAAVLAEPLLPGPVAVKAHFRVSSRRNWSELWKPAIDALGPVLGTHDLRHPFRPDDDRIVDLELHRTINDSLVNDVIIDIWWRRVTT